jgi:two-component system sensor histidine kinase DegS
VLEDRPIRSVDAFADPNRVGQPAGHPPTHTFLGVPLRTGGGNIGMIGVANRATPYEDEHEDLLTTYAAQVAVAIANARLNDALAEAKSVLEQRVLERTRELNEAKEALADKAQQLQQLLADTLHVQELERQRIAHDLHDGPNQLLVGAMLELKSATERLDRGDQASTHGALKQSLRILHQLEHEIRQAIFSLRPPILDQLGLVPSLRRCAESYGAQTGTQTAFSVDGEPYRLDPSVEICVYRILQEALNNTHAHAAASNVSIGLSFAPDLLTMHIADDGLGFRSDTAAASARFGLLGMRERAEMIGGKLIIASELSRGTTIDFWLPIR